jgi:hypothetical protein
MPETVQQTGLAGITFKRLRFQLTITQLEGLELEPE